MKKPRFNEQDLLNNARKLDPGTLTEIYDLYNNELYIYAMRLTGVPDLAEECVSEVFSRFLDVLERGRGPKKYLRAYLYRMAHNWITDQFRRGIFDVLTIDEVVSIPAIDNPAREAHRNMRIQAVRKALIQLTPDQRQVISLRFLQGWELSEIAAALNKPVGAVKALQHRGIGALRRLLADDKNV